MARAVLAHPAMVNALRTVTLSLLVAACGGAADDGPAPGDVVGAIQIEEARLDATTAVATIYASFVDPGEAPRFDDGTCVVRRVPCLGSVGACGTPPQYSAGRLDLTGLAQPVTLVPDAETHAYPWPTNLPPDLFADGATIGVTAAGAAVDGFTLATTGVTPLVSPYAGASPGLVPGQPHPLTWTPAADGARIRFLLNWADVCHAGAEWYVITCEVPDTGAFTIPAAATGALPATSFGPCGGGLARIRRATLADRPISVTVASADYFGFL